jgi:hypothetical protein
MDCRFGSEMYDMRFARSAVVFLGLGVLVVVESCCDDFKLDVSVRQAKLG